MRVLNSRFVCLHMHATGAAEFFFILERTARDAHTREGETATPSLGVRGASRVGCTLPPRVSRRREVRTSLEDLCEGQSSTADAPDDSVPALGVRSRRAQQDTGQLLSQASVHTEREGLVSRTKKRSD